MKINFYSLLLFASLQFFAGSKAGAQTALNAGEISVTGFNAGNGDISFVSWVPLQAGTKVYFTNNGWNSSAATTAINNARNMEEIATWTNTTGSTIAAGTIIITKTATPYTANLGTTTVYSNSTTTDPALVIQDGDQITVYQATTGNGYALANSATTSFSGTAIAILHWPFAYASSGTITNATTYLPSDLAGFSTTFPNTYLNPYQQYIGTRTGKTTEEFKTLVRSSANWTNNWSNPLNASTFTLATSLPVTLLSFNATVKLKDVQLIWKIASEVNVHRYEVENSYNGAVYNTLDVVLANGNSSAINEYRYIHQGPIKLSQYYRLKMVDYDGSFKYSNIAAVKVEALVGNMQVKPNPVVNQELNIRLSNVAAGKYGVYLVSATGQVVFQHSVDATSADQNVQLMLPVIPRGMYTLQLKSDFNAFNSQVLIQ